MILYVIFYIFAAFYIQLSQDIQHLYIRYKTSNAFRTKHADSTYASLDIQYNLRPFKQKQIINVPKKNKYDPYTLMQHDKINFNNTYAVQLAKYTIKNYLQLKSMYLTFILYHMYLL